MQRERKRKKERKRYVNIERGGGRRMLPERSIEVGSHKVACLRRASEKSRGSGELSERLSSLSLLTAVSDICKYPLQESWSYWMLLFTASPKMLR
jgi:hypothetical protein